MKKKATFESSRPMALPESSMWHILPEGQTATTESLSRCKIGFFENPANWGQPLDIAVAVIVHLRNVNSHKPSSSIHP